MRVERSSPSPQAEYENADWPMMSTGYHHSNGVCSRVKMMMPLRSSWIDGCCTEESVGEVLGGSEEAMLVRDVNDDTLFLLFEQ